jgi:hypothetical protein
VLEACVNGRYYWVPFSRLAKVSFDPPEDLRDCVWMPAQLTFANGGETVALVPTRYPGSQDSEDGLILLARKTEWKEAGAERWFGLGQRVLTTDTGDHDLMSHPQHRTRRPPGDGRRRRHPGRRRREDISGRLYRTGKTSTVVAGPADGQRSVVEPRALEARVLSKNQLRSRCCAT